MPGEAILAPPTHLLDVAWTGPRWSRPSSNSPTSTPGRAGRPAGARCPDDEAIAAAVAAARDADVAVVVVGLTEEQETESRDKATLALPGAQDALVEAVAAAARRTVVVVNAATPVLMPWAGPGRRDPGRRAAGAGGRPCGRRRPARRPGAVRPAGHDLARCGRRDAGVVRHPASTACCRTRRAPSSATAATPPGAPRTALLVRARPGLRRVGLPRRAASSGEAPTVTVTLTEHLRPGIPRGGPGVPLPGRRRAAGAARRLGGRRRRRRATPSRSSSAATPRMWRRWDAAAGALGPSRRRGAPRGPGPRGRPAAPVGRLSARLSPRAAASSTGTCAAARPSFGTITDSPATTSPSASRTGTAMPVASSCTCPGISANPWRRTSAIAARSWSGVLDGAVGEPLQRPAQHPLLQLRRAVGEQHEAGRRHVQREPAGDPGVVDDGVACGQPLDEQHLVAVADPELGVVPDDGVQVLEERHGRIAQRERGRRPGGELPHPHPDADLAVGAAG